MRQWVLLLLGCGCNRIFGLGDVTARDASYFDAPLDAAPMCPTDGSAPTFRATLHQIPSSPGCRFASVAEDGTVAALCGTSGLEPWVGTVADGLAPMQFDPPIATPTFQMLRLAPEGDFALALTAQYEVLALARNPDAATWKVEGTVVGLAVTTRISLGTPSRRTANGRHLVTIASNGSELDVFDYVGDHVSWSLAAPMYPAANIGLTSPYAPPSLTADGLRLVIDASVGLGGTFYFERSDPTQPFGPARHVDTIPNTGNNPFMSNDCGTMYFDALDTVLYVYQ